MERIDLTISVVSYDTKDFLKDCLNSIYQYTRGIEFEVILVDNGSTDGSIEMLKRVLLLSQTRRGKGTFSASSECA